MLAKADGPASIGGDKSSLRWLLNHPSLICFVCFTVFRSRPGKPTEEREERNAGLV